MPGFGPPHLVPFHGVQLGLAGGTLGITLLHPLSRGDAVHIRLRVHFDGRPVLVQARERSNVIAGSARRYRRRRRTGAGNGLT